MEAGTVYVKTTSKEEELDNVIDDRRSIVAGLDRNDEKFMWIYDVLLKEVNRNNDMYWREIIPRNLGSELLEHMQIAQYNDDIKGHYQWHSDIGAEGSIKI